MGWTPTPETRLRDAQVSLRIAEEVQRYIERRRHLADGTDDHARYAALSEEANRNLHEARRVYEERLRLASGA